MDTIKNYIKYFKDVTFEESPFNDIDNVLLACIAYLDFDNLLKDSLTLNDLGKKYFNKIDYKEIKKEPLIVRRTNDVFEVVFNSRRYKDLIVSNYVKVVDKEKQFCAMKYKSDKFTYVAYEGTDDSVIGWKEDFEMIYKFPVSSQQMAIDYLNKNIRFDDRKVYVGGHSKGGNLAMVAGMLARPSIKKRIINVFNNDGPGLRAREVNSVAYKKMMPKLKIFVPEEDVVGIILRENKELTVVKSSGKGVFQHNPFNWHCYGPIFIKSELAQNNSDLQDRILRWLNTHNDEKRKEMVDTVFNVLDKSDITYFSDIRQFKMNKILRLLKLSSKLDKDSRDLVISVLKVFLLKDSE